MAIDGSFCLFVGNSARSSREAEAPVALRPVVESTPRRAGRVAALPGVRDVALVDTDIATSQDRLLGRVARGGLAFDERDEFPQVCHSSAPYVAWRDVRFAVGLAERRQSAYSVVRARERRVGRTRFQALPGAVPR